MQEREEIVRRRGNNLNVALESGQILQVLNYLVQYLQIRSSVLMSVIYIYVYARYREQIVRRRRNKLVQGLLEGEEVGALCSQRLLEEVGALCSSHVCEPPSPLNPEPHETSDSEHITQYKIVILILMLALMLMLS